MIASLAMYDRAETAGALGRLWSAFRAAYAGDSPETLCNTGNLWAQWRAPDLLLSQTCGMPYRTSLHGSVRLVGTPVSGLACQPGFYDSVIVARADDPRDTFAAFDGARLAYNEPLSQSGWAAPANLAGREGISFAEHRKTGAHRASADAVAKGTADLAAIDGVTWQMISRWDPVASSLKIVTRTEPTPALPYITAPGRNTKPIFDALGAAIKDLPPADRDALSLYGVTYIPAEAYLAVPTPEPPQ